MVRDLERAVRFRVCEYAVCVLCARRKNLFASHGPSTSVPESMDTPRTATGMSLRDPGGDEVEDALARQHGRRDRLTTLAIGILTVDHEGWAPRRAEQRSAWVNAAHALAPMVNVRFVFRCGT